MTFSTALALNGLVFLGTAQGMAILGDSPTSSLLEKSTAQYVFGGDDLGACPAGYRPVQDLEACQLALDDLKASDVGQIGTGLYLKTDYFPSSSSTDPPGCFQFSWEGGGQIQNALYFNDNLAAVPDGGHSVGRHFACVQEEFVSFEGEWAWVGSGLASTTLTSTISWSTTTTKATTNAFTFGLEEGLSASFAGTGLSVSSSQSWSTSVADSVAHMDTETLSYACQSMSCETGNLYQWQIVGKGAEDQADQTNKQCSFVCVPEAKDVKPLCPAGWCGDYDTNGGCQCCSGNGWAENGEDVPLC